jgi:hypothetical protein
MLVSNDSLPRVRTCLTAALAYVRPDVIRIALSGRLFQQKWDQHLEHIAKVNEKFEGQFIVTPGANSRSEVAAARWRLYNATETEWIVNVDDDDGPLGPYPLDDLPKDVGCVHSDVLGVARAPVGKWVPGDCIFRRSASIKEAGDAHMFKGSYYAYRLDAWNSVRKYVGTETAYEEWRVVWHMITLGWKDFYVPQMLQWHGLRDFLSEAAAVRASGMSWDRTRKELSESWKHRK